MNSSIDVQANRLWNFRQVIKAVGGVNEAARIMGKKNSYITAISGPNPNRSIGNRMCATIEKSFGLTPGSLDLPPPKEAKNNDAHLARISATLANATTADKEFVLAFAEWLVGRSMKLPTKTVTGTVIKASDIDV